VTRSDWSPRRVFPLLLFFEPPLILSALAISGFPLLPWILRRVKDCFEIVLSRCPVTRWHRYSVPYKSSFLHALGFLNKLRGPPLCRFLRSRRIPPKCPRFPQRSVFRFPKLCFFGSLFFAAIPPSFFLLILLPYVQTTDTFFFATYVRRAGSLTAMRAP